jgi:stage IV sporulation protein FB
MIRGLRSAFASLGDIESGPVFGIAGLPVRVHLTFWLLLGVLGWQSHAALGFSAIGVWIAVAAASVLLHELGHATMARRWGVVQGIHLHGVGGHTKWRLLTAPRWWKKALVIAGGPAAGALLAAMAWPLVNVPASPLLRLAVGDLFYVNTAWTVFNLLPIEPLDGGQLFRTLVERGEGVKRDVAVAAVGTVASIAGVLLAIGAAQVLAILPIVFAGLYNLERLLWKSEQNRHTRWDRPAADDSVRDRY